MKRRRTTRSDPLWIIAKFASSCVNCETQIRKGDRILYYPRMYAMCETCGEPEWKDLLAERSMDRFGTDCMYDC